MKNLLTGVALVLTFGVSTSAWSGCEVLQKLVNEGEIKQKTMLQIGGVQALQAGKIKEAVCQRFTQELVNKGTITQEAMLLIGGVQALQYVEIGSK